MVDLVEVLIVMSDYVEYFVGVLHISGESDVSCVAELTESAKEVS